MSYPTQVPSWSMRVTRSSPAPRHLGCPGDGAGGLCDTVVDRCYNTEVGEGTSTTEPLLTQVKIDRNRSIQRTARQVRPLDFRRLRGLVDPGG